MHQSGTITAGQMSQAAGSTQNVRECDESCLNTPANQIRSWKQINIYPDSYNIYPNSGVGKPAVVLLFFGSAVPA